MKNIYRYFTGAGILLAIFLISSCGSSGASNTSSANSNSTTANTNKTNSAETANSNSAETETRDMSPVTVTMDDLYPELMAYDSTIEKLSKQYLKRELTVTDAFLSEIKYSEITVDDSRPSNGNYIWCRGSFSEYEESASNVKKLSEMGKPLKATVKGTLISIKSTSADQVQFIMEPCVLVNVEKES